MAWDKLCVLLYQMVVQPLTDSDRLFAPAVVCLGNEQAIYRSKEDGVFQIQKKYAEVRLKKNLHYSVDIFIVYGYVG